MPAMDIDAGNAAENTAGNARPCPHCGDLLSARQIGRHLAQRRHELGQYVAALLQDEEDDNDNRGNGDGDSNGERPPDDLEPLAEDLGDAAIGMEGVENADDPEILGSVANMSLADDEESVLAPPPELQHVQGLRRNPPVTIEDWPDPEDDNSAASEDDEGPINDVDQDPAYVERDPLAGFGPEDEPVLDDEQLRAFLEAELGDLADEEWLCHDPGHVMWLAFLVACTSGGLHFWWLAL
ncbi:hypothetical protein BDV93DRAFT_510076 [Ceratobasidium sp. AG-I]|nr:hypothetical protein BDV93DRAFT_510076 [Ceratobasidium sp. AG-I]